MLYQSGLQFLSLYGISSRQICRNTARMHTLENSLATVRNESRTKGNNRENPIPIITA